MKGTEAEYVVPLGSVYRQPYGKRPRKAMNVLRRFAFKHTRKKDVVISKDLNEFIWKNSYNVPRKVNVVFRLDGDKVFAYLKGSKQLAADKAKKEAEKDKKGKGKGKDAGKEGKEAGDAEKKHDASGKAAAAEEASNTENQRLPAQPSGTRLGITAHQPGATGSGHHRSPSGSSRTAAAHSGDKHGKPGHAGKAPHKK